MGIRTHCGWRPDCGKTVLGAKALTSKDSKRGGKAVNAEEVPEAARDSRLVAVILAGSPQDARQKSVRALEAGVQLTEIAGTTPKAVEQQARLVGAGTVLTGRDAGLVLEAGAEFVPAPNFSREVRDRCWAVAV